MPSPCRTLCGMIRPTIPTYKELLDMAGEHWFASAESYAIVRRICRWIFPVGVFGSESTNSIARGYL